MVFHSRALVLSLLLPLIAAQTYPAEPLPTSTAVEDPAPTYIAHPPPSYTADPGPEPESTYTTITYNEPGPSSTIGDLPVVTYPACVPGEGDCPPCIPGEGECPCVPGEGDCPPCIPGEGDCPYPVSSTVAPEPECTPDTTRQCPPPIVSTYTPNPYPTTPLVPPIASPSPTSTPTSSNTCVCFRAPCTPCNGTPIPYPQTIYTTVLHTITSCAASIPTCPLGSITTSTISLSTIPQPPPTQSPVYTTIYTTAYIDICPTGLTTKTYTITQTCTHEACHGPTSTDLPEHFTTTEKVCGACEGKPTVTVTCPVASETATAAPPTKAGCPDEGCPGETGKPMAPPPCSGPDCPEVGGNTVAGGAAMPTGSGSGSGSACPYGESCPPGGNSNGTSGGPYVTTGAAESMLVGGMKVLVIGGFVGGLVLML